MYDKKYSMFIDDERFPKINPPVGDEWVIVRSATNAYLTIINEGWPTYISFDHDLGNNSTGYDIAKWLVEHDLDTGTMPDDFAFNVHSANPIGGNNIRKLLNNYMDLKK